MKQAVSDKYTIAWFRLAECVSRGERERALGVYRLLSHSIGNPAFESQLEGDLYLSFQDVDTALVKYQEAVKLYRQTGRMLEAAAVLEHLVTLDTQTVAYHQQLIELYHILRLTRKVHERITSAVNLIDEQSGQEMSQFLDFLADLSSEYKAYAIQVRAE